MKKIVTLDCEVYSNYFLAQFKDHSSGKVVAIEKFNDSSLDTDKLHAIMQRFTTIGFNSLSYDLPVIVYAMMGASNAQIKKLSDEIVTGNDAPWQTLRKYDIELPLKAWDHIDIKDPAPSIMVGLKTYGARLGAPKLQDLPIDPSEIITDDQVLILKAYCENDLNVTWLVYNAVKHEIDLRE